MDRETLISGRLIEIRLCILPTSDMNLYAAIQIPGDNSRKDSHLDAAVVIFLRRARIPAMVLIHQIE